VRAENIDEPVWTDLLDLGQGRRRPDADRNAPLCLNRCSIRWPTGGIRANEKGFALNIIRCGTGLARAGDHRSVQAATILNNCPVQRAEITTVPGMSPQAFEQVAFTDTSTLLAALGVHDTGIGSLEAQIGNLSKPFVQIESDFCGKERVPGWGLGLSILPQHRRHDGR